MKPQNLLKLFLSVMMVMALVTGCKKEDASVSPEDNTEQLTNASDEARFSMENEAANDEINQVALMHPRFRGLHIMAIVAGHVPCNAVIDSSLVNQGTITVTFNGNSCNGHTSRTGSITLQLPYDPITQIVTPWADAGAVLTVTFNNYAVTRMPHGRTITLNGTKYITNVNGGLVDDAVTFTTPIVHHITGMMQITFDNNTTRTWNIDRTRNIARTNSVTTVTITGNATQNGVSNVASWGINRHGNTFNVSIPTPIVLSSDCSFHGMSGVVVHQGGMRTLTVTYGVDQSGNPVTSGCPYGYRLNWTRHNGTPMQVVVAY